MTQSGRVAVVKGSSKGIGFAIAEALVGAGASVTVSARNAEEVSAAVTRLNRPGKGRALGVPCDVRRPDAVAELIRRTVAEFGGLDILVNNAGIGHFSPVAELPVERWQQVIETNLSGAFYCCHEAIPHLRRRGGGWIINIASLAGKNPMAGGTAYNASKFGLVGFSEALLLDVRHDNIRVSCLMPGSVATQFNDHTPSEADAWKIQPEDIAGVV
jgi:3-oxoacyl-[acyl-carrier protein] reductase